MLRRSTTPFRQVAIKERYQFLDWLKQNFPELAERYHHNVDEALVKGGKMTINNAGIGYAARQAMIGALKQYYETTGGAG